MCEQQCTPTYVMAIMWRGQGGGGSNNSNTTDDLA